MVAKGRNEKHNMLQRQRALFVFVSQQNGLPNVSLPSSYSKILTQFIEYLPTLQDFLNTQTNNIQSLTSFQFFTVIRKVTMSVLAYTDYLYLLGKHSAVKCLCNREFLCLAFLRTVSFSKGFFQFLLPISVRELHILTKAY